MAWAYVQSALAATVTAAASVTTPALGAAVTVGNRLVAGTIALGSGTFTATVTDNKGNTWTKHVVAGTAGGIGGEVALHSAPVTAGGTGLTATATFSGSGKGRIAVAEYSGLSDLSGNAGVDASAGANGAGGTAASGATGATTFANELGVACYGDNGWSLASLTMGAGWTARQTGANDGAAEIQFGEHDSGASGSTLTGNLASGVPGGTVDWAMVCVVFKPAGAPPPPPQATYVAAGAAAWTATSGASFAPGLPAGWAADDVHVLVLQTGNNTTFTAPSGYTQIAALSGNSTTALRAETWWRRAVAGYAAPSCALSSNAVTVPRGGRVYGVRGCPPTGDPFDQTSLLANAAAATIAFTDVTTATAGCLALAVGCYEDDPTTITTMTNWTQPAGAVAGTTVGTDMMQAHEYRQLAAAGAAGASSVTVSGGTFTNSPSVGLVLALEPDVPAASFPPLPAAWPRAYLRF